MRGRRFSVLLLSAALALATTAFAMSALAGGKEPRKAKGGLRKIDVILPGNVIDFATPRRAGGALDLVVLTVEPRQVEVEPPQPEIADPCHPPEAPVEFRLWHVDFDVSDPAATPQVRAIADLGIGPIYELVPADLEQDGDDELLLPGAGRLWVSRRGTEGFEAPTIALEDPALGRGSWRAWRNPVSTKPLTLALPDSGEVRFLRPDAATDGWREWTRLSTRLDTRLRSEGLELRTAIAVPVGGDSSSPIFATQPRAFGDQRLQMWRLEPHGGGRYDCWARLPEAEEVLSAHYLEIGDRPLLLVTTRDADKMAFFAEKRLRLLPLNEDRSRTGHLPIFTADSRINLWQAETPFVLDVNEDDRPDLVLGYWKGLTDDRVVLDAYLANENGGFEEKPRSTGFDVKRGERGYVGFGDDIDGDGRADLLVIGNGRLQLHAGGDPSRGDALVSSRPTASVEIDGAIVGSDSMRIDLDREGLEIETSSRRRRRIRIADLDGDGRSEMLIRSARETGDKAGLSIIRLADPTDGR